LFVCLISLFCKFLFICLLFVPMSPNEVGDW
jgi:hypothetical protein